MTVPLLLDMYNELVIDVFYIFNSTVIDWTCFIFFHDLVSATSVTEYSGDAGFLCDRPEMIRNRINETFCISVRFVLKCWTTHCLLWMWQLETHNLMSQRKSSSNVTADEQPKPCHGSIGKPTACYRGGPSSVGHVSYKYFCLPQFASLHHCSAIISSSQMLYNRRNGSVFRKENFLKWRTPQNKTSLISVRYEGWNFNSGNYLFTTDTK